MAFFPTPFPVPSISMASAMALLKSGAFLNAGGLGTSGDSGKDFPKQFCWIRALDPTQSGSGSDISTIRFQFMPASITDVKAAQYGDIAIIGRSSPFKSYAGSSARVLSFVLEFYAGVEMGDSSETALKVKKTIESLRGLVHPVYKNFTVYPPPRCIVHVGDQFMLENSRAVGGAEFIGVCKSCNINYSTVKAPWTSKNQGDGKHLSFGATAALIFEEVQDIPLGFNDVDPEAAEQQNRLMDQNANPESPAISPEQEGDGIPDRPLLGFVEP